MKLIAFLVAAALGGCSSGTTGSGLVTFSARAGGPADATSGAPLEFDTGSGYHVSLTMARFHLGAVYLNMTVPSSGGPEEPCLLPGIYVGQALGGCQASGVCGLDLDLLSASLSPFTIPGQGTVNHAVEADVWLTSGDINAASDPVPVLQAAGTATRNSARWPFTATVTVGANRAVPVQNPAMPGANPICRQRIASLIPIDFTLQNGGTLDVRVDPRGMFNGVDFASLAPGGSATTIAIPDQPGGAGGALFKGVLANAGVYQFTWTNP